MGKRGRRVQEVPLGSTKLSDDATPIEIVLTASPSFFERAPLQDCVATSREDVDASNPQKPILLNLEQSADLVSLVAWFREGCGSNHSASLSFPSTLSKTQRAKIHTLVKDIGLGVIQSISGGVGDSRHISINHSSVAVSREDPTDAQRHKAFWIYKWANAAGIAVSRDEVVEMVQGDNLSPDLQQVWVTGSAKQKLIIRICDAIVEDDMTALRVRTDHEICAQPDMLVSRSLIEKEVVNDLADDVKDVVRSGQYDLISGHGLLHSTARQGNIPAMELLLAAGAPIDAADGHGLTALQVSRKHPEQCDAEAFLLRRGAQDTSPQDMPLMLDKSDEGFQPEPCIFSSTSDQSHKQAMQ